MNTNLLAGIWYASLYEIKRNRRMAYVQEGNSAETLFCNNADNELLHHYFTKADQRLLFDHDRRERTKQMALEMERNSIRFCSYEMQEYPGLLRTIPDPPYGLFYRGELPRKDRLHVGVVGARACTEYGRRLSLELGKRLAQAGIGVVSGMAAGIDSASHAGALTANGKTYAVLGCGCDICYPASSRNIYQQIPDMGGLLSEYVPQTRPLACFFPERNRIISGLAEVLVVIEARERSGSLITVDCALDQGRDIYAVPGRIGDQTSKGCHRLIEQGATILYDPDHFIEEMRKKAALKNKWTEEPAEHAGSRLENMALEKEERLVYSCLDLHPKNVFILLEETGLSLDALLGILLVLKNHGLVQEVQRNAYTRTMVES